MTNAVAKVFFTVQEAAELFGCSSETVYKKVREGDWPHTRPFGARHVRFTQAQLDQIAALGAVEPAQSQPRRRKAS